MIDNDGETFRSERAARKAASDAYGAEEEGGDWSLRSVTAKEAKDLRDRDWDEDGQPRRTQKQNPRVADIAARKACAREAKKNPGQLVALGWLSRLELSNGKNVRVPRKTLPAYAAAYPATMAALLQQVTNTLGVDISKVINGGKAQ